MTALPAFNFDDLEVTEVDAPEHEIVLGPEVVRSGKFYQAALKSGAVCLVPVDSIHEEERVVWENPLVRNSIVRGLSDVASGQVHSAADLLADVDLDD